MDNLETNHLMNRFRAWIIKQTLLYMEFRKLLTKLYFKATLTN